MPSRAEAAAFLETFADSNRRLAAMIGVPQAFDAEMTDYPEVSTYRPLDPEFKLRNLMALTQSLRGGLKTET